MQWQPPFRPLDTQPEETLRYLRMEHATLPPPERRAPRTMGWLRRMLTAAAPPPAARPSRGYLRRE